MTRFEAREEGLMLAHEISQTLDVSTTTLIRWGHEGKIPSVMVQYNKAFRRFYKYEDVHTFLQSKKKTEKERLVYEEDQRPYGVKKKKKRVSKYTPMKKRRIPSGKRKQADGLLP